MPASYEGGVLVPLDSYVEARVLGLKLRSLALPREPGQRLACFHQIPFSVLGHTARFYFLVSFANKWDHMNEYIVANRMCIEIINSASRPDP